MLLRPKNHNNLLRLNRNNLFQKEANVLNDT